MMNTTKLSLSKMDTFEEWGNVFMTKKHKEMLISEISEKYFVCIQIHLRHANDFLGDMKLCDIRSIHIDEMLYSSDLLNYQTQKNLSHKTIKAIRNIVIQVFDFAIENEIFIHNPARKRKVPSRALKKIVQPLNEEEIQLVQQVTNHQMYVASMVFLFSGVRRGELIPLEWRDIDFKNKIIDISKSVSESKSQFFVKQGAKSLAGTRKIPVLKRLIAVLQEEQKKSNSKYVISQLNGEMHTPSSFTQSWRSYLKEINIACWHSRIGGNLNEYYSKGFPQIIHITPHQFRHTYITMLHSAGIPVENTAKIVGHSDITTTMNIYTHITSTEMKISIDDLEEFIDNIF